MEHIEGTIEETLRDPIEMSQDAKECLEQMLLTHMQKQSELMVAMQREFIVAFRESMAAMNWRMINGTPKDS